MKIRDAFGQLPRVLGAVVIVSGFFFGAMSPSSRADETAVIKDAAPVPPPATEAPPPAAAKVEEPKSAELGTKDKEVGDGDQLGFRQEKIAEEMKELEDRMFRLADGLRAREPENSSRLMLGLKYAREELILHQMKEVREALATLKLSDASIEEKQLIAKLQRLQDLLLSPDLDLQLKLERLRQIREILRQLDVTIKEEDREHKASSSLAKEEKPAGDSFASLKKDQVGNHKSTDSISDRVRGLGDSGASALAELIRAGGSMGSAEGNLDSASAGPASDDQLKALESLKYARNQLQEEADRLLNDLRGEVKKRVLEGLAQMLERQTAVRESTTSLGPRVKEGSRQALASLVGLAKSEGKIIDIADELVNLVEETEFGIALPAALTSVREGMTEVKTWLAAADASEKVVAAERQIEEDLQGLLDAMKRMPSRGKGGGDKKGGGGDPNEQERELNRLIAELKMVRVLQIRVNSDTDRADNDRPKEIAKLSAALTQQIRTLEQKQDNVEAVTERLGAERSVELPDAQE